MMQADTIERQTIESERWPWSVSSLRALLMEAAEAGFRLGIENPGLAAAAGEGAILPAEVGDGFDVVEAVVESQRYTAELRLGGDLEAGAAYWLEMAIEAAVILGLQAAVAQSDSLPPAPKQMLGVVSNLLVNLVETLAANGYPVSGAQYFLDDLLKMPETTRELATPNDGPEREVRTGWVNDCDTGRRYQWCVLRQGTEVYIARRRAGERRIEPELSLRAAEADLLGRLLKQAVEGWSAA